MTAPMEPLGGRRVSIAREPPARLRRGRCRLRAQMAAAGWVAAGPLGYLFLMWMERNIMPQAAARCAAALRLAGLAASLLPARGSRGLLVFGGCIAGGFLEPPPQPSRPALIPLLYIPLQQAGGDD